ncbi:MAG: metallopeptidase family protein [Alphaproteobacteria bacterium]
MHDTKDPLPSPESFGAIAEGALARLPDRFRQACRNVAILVEDFPEEAVCREMQLDSPYDLLGLYDGVDIVTRSLDGWQGPPDVILLYRMPILQFAAAEQHLPGDVIAHVLIHEIGHHMGFSDEDMALIEEEADLPDFGAIIHDNLSN